MIKALQLCTQLFQAIKGEKWNEANELCEKLSIVLDTYKKAC